MLKNDGFNKMKHLCQYSQFLIIANGTVLFTRLFFYIFKLNTSRKYLYTPKKGCFYIQTNVLTKQYILKWKKSCWFL